MRNFDVEWRNFRSFENTGPLEIRPITVVIGSNNSGKTSLLAPLLLLKQTLESPTRATGLLTNGPLTNVGSFRDIVFQHRSDRTVSFTLTWDWSDDDVGPEGDNPIGNVPPVSARFDFSRSDTDDTAELCAYEVKDVYGRTMMLRRRSKDGHYTLEKVPELGEDEASDFDVLAQAILEQARPHHFLFTSEAFVHATIAQLQRLEQDAENLQGEDAEEGAESSADIAQPEEGDDGPTTDPGPDDPFFPSKSVRLYTQIATIVENRIHKMLGQLHYIGPLRERPRRVYELSGEMPRDVGTRGEFAPEIIYRWEDRSERMQELQRWLRHFGFSEKLEAIGQGEYAFSLRLRRNKNAEPTALIDLGFGTSQILPLIVQGLISPRDRMIVAEQPEIHLNPALQAKLADLFVSFANDKHLSVFIETHSEHLLLRLRRLVAEDQIRSDDIAIYYVDRVRGRSRVRRVEMDDMGHIEAWPDDFFEEGLHESIGLAEAQVARAAEKGKS